MQNDNTIVFETTPESDWSGDRPLYLALAGSGLAAGAIIPVLLAIWGPTPMLPLLLVALVAGLLVGMLGLLCAGLTVSTFQLIHAARSGRSLPKDTVAGVLRGKLAFG